MLYYIVYIYNMAFFDQSLVDKFTADYGSAIKLYRLSDMFTLFKVQSRSRRTFLAQIIKDSCAANIGESYRNTLSGEVVNKPNDYDFIAVASSDIDIGEDPQSKYAKIQGFMVVERGECKTYPDNYCVNLICTKSSVGNILMALYIYIIIQRDDFVNKIGLLELANAYYNVGGLCLYAKYGFKFDENLSNETCFKYFTPNLPMIANIEEYGGSKEEKTSRLLSILKTGSGSFDKPSICAVRGNKQKLLGLVLNLQLSKYVDMSSKMGESKDRYLEEYVYGKYNTPHIVSDGTEIDYKKLLDKIESEYGGVDTFIESGINGINEAQADELVKLVVKPPLEEIKIMAPEPVARITRTTRSGRTVREITGGKRQSRRKNTCRRNKKTRRTNRYKNTHRRNKKTRRM